MLKQIFKYLEAYDSPVYLVGGSLRQLLLGLPVKDYDFVVPRQATQLAYKLAKLFQLSCFPLDKERDMARVILPDVVLDFACYGEDLNQDLMLRDLTINAMACPVTEDLLTGQFITGAQPDLVGRLLDPCQGLADLAQGLIKAVRIENFLADPLRLMRVYRFAACLNFKIEAQTENWVQELAASLQKIAAERILQEFQQILLLPNSVDWLQKMSAQGLLAFLPPSLQFGHLETFERMSSQQSYLGVDQKLVQETYLQEVLAAQRPRIFIFKLALLCLCQDESRGQSSLSLLEALTLSRAELDTFTLWQKLFQTLLHLMEDVKDPIGQRFFLFRQAKADIQGLVLLGRVWCHLGLSCDPQQQLNQLLEEWLDLNNPIAHPSQLINGNRLMQALHIKPGPQIGKLLLGIQEAQARGLVSTSEQALEYAQSLLSRDS